MPAMSGWESSEVGHQHYQHPQRDAQHFDATLDNFSALVIYLSLISLAEKPELWNEYHDENLIFTKSDFIEPAASELFAKIRGIGSEHEKLAEVLVEGTKQQPLDVPCVLDLVTVKSSLPSWMTAPDDLKAKTKTREVVHAQAVTAGPKWVPWQAKRAASNVPATPASSTVQTLFGPPPALSSTRDPSAVLKNTPHFAKELLKRTFLWWYWGLYVFLKIIGLDFFSAFLIALLFLTLASLTYGFIRAQQLANAARAKALSTGILSPPLPPMTWQRGMPDERDTREVRFDDDGVQLRRMRLPFTGVEERLEPEKTRGSANRSSPAAVRFTITTGSPPFRNRGVCWSAGAHW